MADDFKRFRDDVADVLEYDLRTFLFYHLKNSDSLDEFISRFTQDIEEDEKDVDATHDRGMDDAEYELIRDGHLIMRVIFSLLVYEFQRNALNIQPKDMWDMYTNIFER